MQIMVKGFFSGFEPELSVKHGNRADRELLVDVFDA